MTSRVLSLCGLLIFSIASRALAVEPNLEVTYGNQKLTFDAAKLASLAWSEVDATDMGRTQRYRAVPVGELLKEVKAPLGEELRGSALALVVRAKASDGYTVVYSLAEFDPAFRSRPIYLVDQQNGKPLSPSAGPLRLLCPGDSRGARGIRQLVSLEIISLTETSSVK